jgi:hypothetical protein
MRLRFPELFKRRELLENQTSQLPVSAETPRQNFSMDDLLELVSQQEAAESSSVLSWEEEVRGKLEQLDDPERTVNLKKILALNIQLIQDVFDIRQARNQALIQQKHREGDYAEWDIEAGDDDIQPSETTWTISEELRGKLVEESLKNSESGSNLQLNRETLIDSLSDPRERVAARAYDKTFLAPEVKAIRAAVFHLVQVVIPELAQLSSEPKLAQDPNLLHLLEYFQEVRVQTGIDFQADAVKRHEREIFDAFQKLLDQENQLVSLLDQKIEGKAVSELNPEYVEYFSFFDISEGVQKDPTLLEQRILFAMGCERFISRCEEIDEELSRTLPDLPQFEAEKVSNILDQIFDLVKETRIFVEEFLPMANAFQSFLERQGSSPGIREMKDAASLLVTQLEAARDSSLQLLPQQEIILGALRELDEGLIITAELRELFSLQKTCKKALGRLISIQDKGESINGGIQEITASDEQFSAVAYTLFNAAEGLEGSFEQAYQNYRQLHRENALSKSEFLHELLSLVGEPQTQNE